MRFKKDCAVVISLILSIATIKTAYCSDLFKDVKKQSHNTTLNKLLPIALGLLDEKTQGQKNNVIEKTQGDKSNTSDKNQDGKNSTSNKTQDPMSNIGGDKSIVNKIRAIAAKTKMPEGSKIYITGDFNKWNYNDQAMELKQIGEMYENNQECFIYEGNFNLKPGSIYKYSRGSADSVEVDFTLQDEKNKVTADKNGNYLLNDYIYDWKDFFYTPNGELKVPDYINNGKVNTASLLDKNNKVEVTFAVTVPENADNKDNIYLCGDFNNWDYSDKTCKLEKQDDGTYQIKKTLSLNTRYKFSRGSEDNCEMGYFRLLDKDYGTINIKIENWIDR